MRRRLALILAAALLVSRGARAATSEPITNPPVDTAPCFAANDDNGIIADCAAVIGHDKTATPDRIRALTARAGAFARKEQIDRAVADHDALLQLDPSADTFNARGELFRKQGNLPRALADFGAALKLNKKHSAARANYKSLALELEQIGAQRAVVGKPSFNCAMARRPVERAICANPELADLDREVDGAFRLVLREIGEDTPVGHRLRREQAAFIAKRNASFGRPVYDLKAALRARRQQLLGRDGY